MTDEGDENEQKREGKTRTELFIHLVLGTEHSAWNLLEALFSCLTLTDSLLCSYLSLTNSCITLCVCMCVFNVLLGECVDGYACTLYVYVYTCMHLCVCVWTLS